MKRALLKQLVTVSYKNNELDRKQTEKIAALLSRKELKMYIRALKEEEKKRTVFVKGASDLSVYKKDLQAIFPDKRVFFATDASLLAGIQITYADNVYEVSMQNTLKQLQEYVNE